MSDIDLHAEFDRLDTGIADHPDLAGLWAGGQRRRRRTRAIWTAGALATAAVVAPLALLVGGGATTGPSGTSGFAAAPAAATTEADPLAIEAAVLELFPGAQVDESTPGTFTLTNGVTLEVHSGPAMQFACDACSLLSVGDQEIWVGHAGESNGPTTWSSIATTTPVTAEDGSAVQVEVEARFVTEKQSDGRAQLPADEVLAELAADRRMKPESGWTEQAAGETAALAEMSAAIEERLPGLHTSYARHGDVTGAAAGERVVATERDLESEGSGSYRLNVYSGTNGYRTDCYEKSTPPPTSSCTQVGDMTVQVIGGQDAPDMSEAFWSVSVYPTDPSRTEKVEVNAFVKATSWEEAVEKLPSVETLTEIALDERLAPPTR